MSTESANRSDLTKSTDQAVRIVAVVDKTADKQGYIVRALRKGEVIYIRVPATAFQPGWDSIHSTPPDLSFIPSDNGRKVWRIEIISKGANGIALKLEARTHGVPHDLPRSTDGFPNITSADYTKLKIVRNFPDSYGRRSERVSLVTYPDSVNHREQLMVMKIAEIPDHLPADENDTTVIGTAEAEMRNEIDFHYRLREQDFVPEISGLVYEKGRGIIGYLMEYIIGATTYEHIRAEGRELHGSEIQRCLDVVYKMHHMHIYHGDLHTGNLLRCPDGSIKIVDFQYAKQLGPGLSVEGSPIFSARMELSDLHRELTAVGRPQRRYLEDGDKFEEWMGGYRNDTK